MMDAWWFSLNKKNPSIGSLNSLESPIKIMFMLQNRRFFVKPNFWTPDFTGKIPMFHHCCFAWCFHCWKLNGWFENNIELIPIFLHWKNPYVICLYMFDVRTSLCFLGKNQQKTSPFLGRTSLDAHKKRVSLGSARRPLFSLAASAQLVLSQTWHVWNRWRFFTETVGFLHEKMDEND